MSSKDFNRFGEELKNTIDSAVESGDFKDLSTSISRILNDAIDQVKESIPTYLDEGQRKARDWTSQQTSRLQEQYKQSEARRLNEQRRLQEEYKNQANRNQDRNRRSWEASFDRRRSQETGSDMGRKQELMPYSSFYAPRISMVKPMLKAVLGGVFTFDFLTSGIGMLALGHHGLMSVLGGLAGIGMSFGLAAVTGVICASGVKQLGMISRFKKYCTVAGRQENIPVKTLARKVNRSLKQTVKDLKYMCKKNWFYEGHIDEEEGYFLLTDKAYREYVNVKADSMSKITEAKKREEEARMEDEVTKLIREGEAYVAHIRTCNRMIPNEELTAKLDHMETLVQRIFEEVKLHPEVSDDMGRMMSYYLPTTAKLLDAYRDLDGQPVQGENIASTKKEIEASIDMLNTAFEKFLDGLFADRAMDISTDISVLNTLLAQEGLKEDDFKINKPELK